MNSRLMCSDCFKSSYMLSPESEVQPHLQNTGSGLRRGLVPRGGIRLYARGWKDAQEQKYHMPSVPRLKTRRPCSLSIESLLIYKMKVIIFFI